MILWGVINGIFLKNLFAVLIVIIQKPPAPYPIPHAPAPRNRVVARSRLADPLLDPGFAARSASAHLDGIF